MCVASYYNWLNSVCQNGNDLQNWNNALTQLSARIFVAVCNILPARDIRYGIARIWAYNVPAAVPACRNCEEYTAHKAEILKKVCKARLLSAASRLNILKNLFSLAELPPYMNFSSFGAVDSDVESDDSWTAGVCWSVGGENQGQTDRTFCILSNI